MSDIEVTQEQMSYFQSYIQAFNNQSIYGSYLLSPQLLNDTLKSVNMNTSKLSPEQVEKMVLAPHNFEQELRKLSLHYYNSIGLYKQMIEFMESMLTFDWEPIPYKLDGTPITATEFRSKKYKDDFAELTKFFNSFPMKREFKKVLSNICRYDTYYTSVREYDGHIYLQELPSSHCAIDANSYLGYLFSFDLSYFTNNGVDINAYSPSLRAKYRASLKNTKTNFKPNLPSRNGRYVDWVAMQPDDAWVFKFNDSFAGSVPPLLSMMIDSAKIDKYKELEDAKKALEAMKLIVGEVPTMSQQKTGQKVDNFTISAEELGKFNAAFQRSLNNDYIKFQSSPLKNVKAIDFLPSSSEKDLLETELKNIMCQSGISSALSMVDTVNVASAGIYKAFNAARMEKLYNQFETFLEYQVNKRTKNFKFKIKMVGTIFDKDERRKNADADMAMGIWTPALFSSRGIQITDSQNVMGMMSAMGFPECLTPAQTSYNTAGDKVKDNKGGRPQKDESELSEEAANTRDKGTNVKEGDV